MKSPKGVKKCDIPAFDLLLGFFAVPRASFLLAVFSFIVTYPAFVESSEGLELI